MRTEINNNEIEFDLNDIIMILKKKYRIILATTISVAILVGIISFIIPPTYQGVAVLRIKEPQGGLADSLLSSLPLVNDTYIDQLVATYAEILKSRYIIDTVIKRTQAGKETIPTYEEMLKKIDIEPVKDTQILNVMVKANSAVAAKTVTNTLVEVFLDRLTQLDRSEQVALSDFIRSRFQDSKQDLLKAEQALADYQQSQKILTPDEEVKTMIDRFAQIDQLAAENKLEIAMAQAKLNTIQTQLSSENKALVADSPLIQQYNSKLADLEIQLTGLLEQYTPKHPQVLATNAEIAEIKNKLNNEISRVINEEAPSLSPLHQNLLLTKFQAEADIKAAQAQAESIVKIQGAHEAEIMKLPAKEQGLTRLLRDASVAQEIYIMLAKRFEEAKIAEMMQQADLQIVDQAITPDKPIQPKKGLNILIGAFLGLFSGTGLVFLSAHLHQTIDTADDVKHYLRAPVLGNIPEFENEEPVTNNQIHRRLKKWIGKR